MSETDYRDGYDKGWEDANNFIDRHPHGMPWAALPDTDEEPAEDDFERGVQVGWQERMQKEGWPTSRMDS